MNVQNATDLVRASAWAGIVMNSRCNGYVHVTDSDRSDASVSSDDIARGIDVRDVLARLIRDVSLCHEVLSAHLWLFDESTRTMRLVGAAGASTPAPEPLDVDHSSIGEPVLSGRAHLGSGSDTGLADRWRYAVPVGAGSVKGAFAIDLIAPSPDVEILAVAAARVRPTLAAALLAHVAAEDRRFAQGTVEWVSRLVCLLDKDAIVLTLLEAALDVAQGEKGSVLLFDSESQTLSIAVSQGLPEQVVESTRVVPGDGMAGWVYSTGEPLVIEDLDERSPRGRRHGVRSAVVVPLGDDEGPVGVINVGSAQFRATFSDSRLTALKGLGRAAAVALRNAEAMISRQELFLETVQALALALETKDPYSQGATRRILELTTQLGDAMGLAPRDMVALKAGALLHDIGMTAAAEDASRRDRPLDTYEWGMLKMHPVIAADVLRQSAALREAIPIVYHHHEHYDGGGYLQGIAGVKIPLGARILSVADAYVAMTSPRPYRDAMSHDEAMTELHDMAGTQFDPAVVSVLVGMHADVSRAER